MLVVLTFASLMAAGAGADGQGVDRPAGEPAPLQPPDVDNTEPDVDPLPVPKPIEPLEPESPEQTPSDKSKSKQKVPPPDEERSLFGAPFLGSAIGCTALGCPAFTGTSVGALVLVTFISAALADGGATGVCLAVFGIAGGLIIGAPSVIALGPCASGGALIGALFGAVLDDRDAGPILIGALPGLALGLLATGGAAWGLAVLSNTSGDYSLPVAILGASALAAIVSGPTTMVGVMISDAAAPASPKRERAPDDTQRAPSEDDDSEAVLAMRY